MLSGTGFGNDAVFTHAACQQYLADGVVYLVRTGMVQVFTLQVNLAAIFFRKAVSLIEWGRTAYVVAQQLVVLTLEVFTLQHFEVSLLQFFHTFVEYLGDVCSAEFSVITFFVN